MDKDRLFEFLEGQDAKKLLELLERAYDAMKNDQKKDVFGDVLSKAPRAAVDGEALLGEVEDFKQESLAGVYYAPFNINSRNFSHVPEETKEWFDRLGELLADSVRLTQQGDHLAATACFGSLFELIEALGQGKDIVFAEELGSWMIPWEKKDVIAAYLRSLAATATPEEFTAAAAPIIKRDSYESFTAKAYSLAIKAASKEQKAHLQAECKRQKIRTSGEK